MYRLLTLILLWAMIKMKKSLKVVSLVVNRNDSENHANDEILYNNVFPHDNNAISSALNVKRAPDTSSLFYLRTLLSKRIFIESE